MGLEDFDIFSGDHHLLGKYIDTMSTVVPNVSSEASLDKPNLKFAGMLKDHLGADVNELYNVDMPGHPLHGSTVSLETASNAGLAPKLVPVANSYPPSSIYDIKAELLKNKAANPPIPTIEPRVNGEVALPELGLGELEGNLARNSKLESLMNTLRGNIGTFAAGAVIPPFLEDIIQKGRQQQNNEAGGA